MDSIVCPHCNNTFELSEALAHQLEEKMREKVNADYQEKLEKQKQEIKKQAEDALSLKMTDAQNEAKEAKLRNEELQKQLLELTKTLRELKDKDEQRDLTYQKQLIADREKMQEDISKTMMEKSHLETLELKKQLDDTKKALEDAQRKAAQKSQQLQGEVLELELEEILRLAFPHDEVQAIGKGINGADIRHIVKTPMGNVCGIILWELKRTKHWDDKWIGKLKEDVRSEKAHVPVIVSAELPDEAKAGMGVKEGVWICALPLVIPLAELLRKNLYDIARQKAVNANSNEKSDLVYRYITSHEFQQQVESLIETYLGMQQELLQERRAFEKMWKVREGQIEKLLHGTAHIIGSMQGRGATIQGIKGLDLPELNSGEDILA